MSKKDSDLSGAQCDPLMGAQELKEAVSFACSSLREIIQNSPEEPQALQASASFVEESASFLPLEVFIDRVLKNKPKKTALSTDFRLFPFINLYANTLNVHLNNLKSGITRNSSSLSVLTLASCVSMHVFTTSELDVMKAVPAHIDPYLLLGWCESHNVQFADDSNYVDETFCFSFLSENHKGILPNSYNLLNKIAVRLGHSSNDSATAQPLKDLVRLLNDETMCSDALKKLQLLQKQILAKAVFPFLERIEEMLQRNQKLEEPLLHEVRDVTALVEDFVGYLGRLYKTDLVIKQVDAEPKPLATMLDELQMQINTGLAYLKSKGWSKPPAKPSTLDVSKTVFSKGTLGLARVLTSPGGSPEPS